MNRLPGNYPNQEKQDLRNSVREAECLNSATLQQSPNRATQDYQRGYFFSYVRDNNESQKRCLRKLVNICMNDGKKTKSHRIIQNTLCRLTDYGDVITYLLNAIENVQPILEVKKVRISGSTQLVPSIISKNRQETLAIRWILQAAIKRRSAKKNSSLDQCLFAEIVDAYNKTGAVRKKRDELHKLAEANRGFSHYRWW